MGLVIFAPMRTRDRLTVFFAAPFAGLLAAGTAIIGYTMMGYDDLPPGTGGRVFHSVAILWGLGIVFGIFARTGEGKRPAAAAIEGSALKRCLESAELIQATARVCRFCGSRFDQRQGV